MSNNKTFFKNARAGNMSLGDIFSEVTRRHTPDETARVLTAGTSITTPAEAEILAGWQKPFLFARFFVGFAAFLLLSFLLGSLLGYMGGYYLLLVGIPFLVPVTLLLMVWEMNVPRNISLYDVVKMTAIGGILSILAAVLAFYYGMGSVFAVWAGLVEEPAKLIVIYAILHKKNYKYAMNGALVGMAVGTGFAVLESLIYVFDGLGGGVLTAMALEEENLVSFGVVLNNYDMIWSAGIGSALYVALARAVTAISGHGIFAALYGGALAKAKGSDDLRINHILNPEFLMYFAVSILLHALHNMGLSLGLPVLLDGLLPCEYIIIAVIALLLLINSLKTCVNQSVDVALAHNDNRFTVAVERGGNAPAAAPAAPVAPVSGGAEFRMQFLTGPLSNQKFKIVEGQSVTLGRVQGNDIVLHGCENVSSKHCKITVTGGKVIVTDLNSTNGTYLDNQRLTPNQGMPVLNGSTICLGNKNCALRIYTR